MARLTLSGTTAQSNQTHVHASCVLIGEAGVLIIGQSGTGKTSLALSLLSECVNGNRFSRMVSDDRTLLSVNGGRVRACSHTQIAGCYELRGLGIRKIGYEKSAIVRLVVHCQAGQGPRYPEPEGMTWSFEGVSLPMISVSQNHHRERLVMACIDEIIQNAVHEVAPLPRQFE